MALSGVHTYTKAAILQISHH